MLTDPQDQSTRPEDLRRAHKYRIARRDRQRALRSAHCLTAAGSFLACLWAFSHCMENAVWSADGLPGAAGSAVMWGIAAAVLLGLCLWAAIESP